MLKRLLQGLKQVLRRNIADDDPALCEGLPRSPHWPEVRAQHLRQFPSCAACGCDDKKELQVHHCVPFSVDRTLELEPGNLITLCEKHACHLMWGHLGSYRSFNVSVREDAAAWLARIKARP